MTPAVNGSNLVEMRPFNMRQLTMQNFVVNEKRSLYRAHAVSMSRYRGDYLIHDADKSRKMLQQLLQEKINADINSLLHKYYNSFFKPAMGNIRDNLKRNSNNKEFREITTKQLFRDILDEARKMYDDDYESDDDVMAEGEGEEKGEKDKRELNGSISKKVTLMAREHIARRANSPIESSFPIAGRARGRPPRSKHVSKIMKSYKANNNGVLKQKLKLAVKARQANGFTLPSVQAETQWDSGPSKLTTDTLFVLGSQANKCLGFGTTRGRLYSKHTHLFRYIADSEDKEWLLRQQLIASINGKTYLSVRDDICELINSPEYSHLPGVNLQDLGEGFVVPQAMINKMVRAANRAPDAASAEVPSEASSPFEGSAFELASSHSTENSPC